MSIPLRLRSKIVLAAAAAGLAMPAVGFPVHAQGRLDARYTVTLAGMPIGRGAWVVDIGDDKFTAAASGATAGILRLFSGGEGTGASRGSVVNGNLVPATFAVKMSSASRQSEVRLALKSGVVKDFSVSPPMKPDPERVPLREAHRRGVTDPMTASLIRVAPNGDPLAPESCQRSAAVFDGRMRYDLHLAYKRTDQVRAAKGYAGPALACGIYFTPIAGHSPDRSAIKYLMDRRDMEIWLVPIAGTTVLVPFRLAIPTPLGLGVLEATQFVTAAHRPRAATAGATTQ